MPISVFINKDTEIQHIKMKLVLLILCFVGINSQDCLDSKINVTRATSTSNSIFLLWKSEPLCSYYYNVSWYPDGKKDDIEWRTLDTDDSKINIDKLTANTEYNITIAVNGSSDELTVPVYTAPEPVTNLTITDNEKTSVTLSWDPPADGARDGNGAEVCMVRNGDEPQCEEIDKVQHKVTGLGACTTYNFKVTSLGYDSYESAERLRSREVTAKHQTLKAVPGAVNNLGISSYSTHVTAEWSLPNWDEAPECVTGYNVTVYNDTDGSISRTVLVSPSKTEVDIPNLDPCSYYNVSVVSVGEEGESGVVTKGRVKTGTMPVPSGSISVTKRSPTWAAFTWDEPSSGEDCLDHYSIYSLERDVSDLVFLENVTAKDHRTYNFTGLQPCQRKIVVIYAVNEEGTLSEEELEYVSSAGEDPGLVTDLTVEPDEIDTYMTHVTWTPPKSNVLCIDRYEVCSVGSYRQCSTTYTNSSYTLTNLKACTNYSIEVTVLGLTVRYGTQKTTVSLPYRTKDVLSSLTITGAGYSTDVHWNWAVDIGIDCMEYMDICWTESSDSDPTCLHANFSSSYLFIPVEREDIYELKVKAAFRDGNFSNELTYKGASVGLQSYPAIVICSLIFLLIQTLNGGSQLSD